MSIGQQRLGRVATLHANIAAANGAPSGDDADRLVLGDNWDVNLLPTCWILRVGATAAGAFSFDAFLWGREAQQEVWGVLGENDGQMSGGNTLSGTTAKYWYFVYQNLEVFQDIYFEANTLVGNPTIITRIFPMYEQAVELRGL